MNARDVAAHSFWPKMIAQPGPQPAYWMTWFNGDGVGLGRFAGMFWPRGIVKVDRFSGGATFREHGDAFRRDDERVGQRQETEVWVGGVTVIVVKEQGWNVNLLFITSRVPFGLRALVVTSNAPFFEAARALAVLAR